MIQEKTSVIVDERITKFISTQTCLMISTVSHSNPFCASCFYTYLENMNMLVFKSKTETQHIQNALKNDSVAGIIHPDKLNKARIRGIQFTGKFIVPKEKLLKEAKKKYYLQYPLSLAMSGKLWVIELDSIKLTDNQLGFGKRLEWEKKK
ncbi:MAG: pyridoxamine 5'-phosphate oxidase family protein [Bacteroidota bacterium]